MKHSSIFLFSLVILGCSQPADKKEPSSEVSKPKRAIQFPASAPLSPFPEEPQKGICYAHAWENAEEGGYGSPKDIETLKRLKELGVEWVSITPFAFQRSKTSEKISGTTASYRRGESDDRLLETAKTAHSLGMKVLLKPHIWIGDSSWCGAIRPPDWDVWIESYEPVVEHYAKLATQMSADGYLIGNELGTATKANPDAFRQMIRLARKHYRGPISYAANWDEAHRIPFWDELDAVGINAYWPLTKNKKPTEEELYQGALNVEKQLAEIAQQTGKPIILTEIGFRSVAGSAVDPNTWPELDRNRTIDFEAQEIAYRAVMRAFWGKPYMKGIYFWKVISDGTWNEEGEGGFSPLDKPASAVLKEFFIK